MPPGRQSWLFTKEQLQNTPSRQDGMSQQEERAVRNSVCKFIHKIGVNSMVTCKALSVNTARIYFHRVCMSQSIAPGRQNPKLVGVTCLFLACKTEENMIPVRELIWAMNRMMEDVDGVKVYPYGTLPAERLVSQDARGDPCWLEDTAKGRRCRYPWMVDEDSLEFQKVRENILQVERLILQVLDFDMTVSHPISHIKDMIDFLDKRRKMKELRRLVEDGGDGSSNHPLTDLGLQIQYTAIGMANDSGSLALALEYDAAVIAAGCVFLAIKAQTNAKPYKLVKVAKWCKELVVHWQETSRRLMDPHLAHVAETLKKEYIEDVHDQMLDLYDEAEQQTLAAPAPPPLASTHAPRPIQAAPVAAPTGAAQLSSALQVAPPSAPNSTIPHEPVGGVSRSAPTTGGHGNGADKSRQPVGSGSAACGGPGPAAPAGPTQLAPDRMAQDFSDLEAGKTVFIKGSGAKPHELTYNKESNIYRCTCTVWKQVPVRDNHKTCRHLCALRGKTIETGRVGEEGITKMEKAEKELLQQQRPVQTQKPGGPPNAKAGAPSSSSASRLQEPDSKRPRTGP